MVNTFDDLTHSVTGILKRHPAVARAEVFGSFARNEQSSKSDIDIILTKRENSILGFEFYKIAEEIEEATGRKVDLLTPAAVRQLVYSDRIMKEARCIYES